MSTRHTEVLIFQYTEITNQYLAHLKLIFHVSNKPQYKKKEKVGVPA